MLFSRTLQIAAAERGVDKPNAQRILTRKPGGPTLGNLRASLFAFWAKCLQRRQINKANLKRWEVRMLVAIEKVEVKEEQRVALVGT